MGDLSSQGHIKKNDMAIVVVSYDGYCDLWDDFFTLLNKYWGNRPYSTYLANNILKPKYENVEVINCGENAQWSTRTRMAVEKIEERYICLLLEDYFIGAEIDENKFSKAIEIMNKDNLKYYKLSTFSKIRSKQYKDFNYLQTIPENLEYGISLQAAIWDKEYLLELLGNDDYNAWKFEVDRAKETKNKTSNSLPGCVFDNRNILNKCHGVAKGKYLPSAIKFFNKQNYILNTSNRAVMSQLEFLLFRIKGVGNNLLPKKYKSKVKRILSRFGIKFVSTD